MSKRRGGVRDENRLTVDMTREELARFFEELKKQSNKKKQMNMEATNTATDIADVMNKLQGEVTLHITAKELRDYSDALARSVAEQMTDNVIDGIKGMLGDKMEYMTAKEVMHYFGLSSTYTLFYWNKKGYLRHHKLGGRNVYFREDVLELAKRRRERKSPTARRKSGKENR